MPGVAVFCHRPARYIDTVQPQDFNDSVVGEDIFGRFGVDQFFDLMTDRFRGMGLSGIGAADRCGEELF